MFRPEPKYDAVVVGARCAGSPTALLLARAGLRVLVVDKAAFPSDTLSTHYIHQPGVAALRRWGVLPRIAASGCPPIRDYVLDVGPFALHGQPTPAGDVADAYSVRRPILDSALLDAAAAAGAEVRTRFTVDELLVEDGRVCGIAGREHGGPRVTERAAIVIGADGLRSIVARAVGAETYDAQPTLTCAYYTYWDGVAGEAVELYPRDGQMIVTAPTNAGQVLTIVFWPVAEFPAVRADLEHRFMQALDDHAPGLALRVRAGVRADRFRGTAQLPNHYRRPFGPGWALVGDAGYHKDPILALGISDAFRDAELLADAVVAGLSCAAPAAEALAGYERTRNARSAAGFASTLQFASLQAPPPELQALFGALRHDQEQTNRFFGTFAGTVAPDEFHARENIAQLMAA